MIAIKETTRSIASWVRNHPRGTAVAFLVLTVVSLLWVFARAESAPGYPWINHDNAVNIHCGRMLLDGQVLYVDRLETVPPAVCWHGMAVSAISRGLDLSPVFVYHSTILLAGALGAIFLLNNLTGQRLAIVLPIVLGYTLVLAQANFTIRDFGQREHLFSLLCMPYLFWRMREPRDEPLRRAYFRWGYLLTLGFVASMKPHFIVLLAATELVSKNNSRPPRRYIWLALIMGIGLSGLFLLVHSPAAVAALFETIIPFHLGGGYAAYNNPLSRLWEDNSWMIGAGFLAALLWMAIQTHFCAKRELLRILFIPVCAYLLFIVQHKFWSYHAAVFFAACTLLGSFVVAQCIDRLHRNKLRRALFVFFVSALLFFHAKALRNLDAQSRILNVHAGILSLTPILKGREPIMFLSTSVRHMYAPFYLDLKTTGDWAFNFELPALLRAGLAAGDPKGLVAYRDDLARRIDAQAPELVVFSPSRQALGVTIHNLLVNIFSLFPRPGYRQLSQQEIQHRTRSNQATRWWIYERIDEEEQPNLDD